MAVVAPAAGPDQSLRGIIADAVQVQLLRRNAPVVQPGADVDPARAASELLPLAAAQGARYLLLCTWSTVDSRLSLTAEMRDTLSSTLLGAGRAEGRVDLSLDEVVARALEDALAGVSFPDRPVAGGNEAPAVPAAGAAPPAPNAAARQSPPAAAAVLPPQRRRTFGLSAGAAPMIPTGPAAAYTDLGLLATAAFELRFPFRVGTLCAGILSGACLFAAEGASSDAFVVIVPLGIDAGWRLGGDGMGFGLHIGGGPALMATTAPAVSTLVKIVPYALAGMSLEIPFSAALGLSVEASYALFFESALLPIMAFAPEVSLYVRF